MRCALLGWLNAAWARCGRPIGSPAARRASSGARSRAKPHASSASAIRCGAGRAVGAEALQLGEEAGVGVVDAVAEDVEVLVVAVDGRQLGGGDDADRAAGRVRGRQRLGDAVDRVVVAEREQLDARGGRAGDDLGRRAASRPSTSSATAGRRSGGGHRCGPYPHAAPQEPGPASALWRCCCARRERARRPVAAAEPFRDRRDDLGVELRAGAAPKLDERHVERPRLAVRAVGGHRVQRVADGDDPGGQRDRVAAQAVGVAGAVVALVDRTHQRGDAGQQRDPGQQRRADRRVLLDLLELVRASAARAW